MSPIISRNSDGSVDHSGNTRWAGVYVNSRDAHGDKPQALQAKLQARKAARERARHGELADQCVREGLASGNEEALSDGLLMRSRYVELTEGATHIGHYAYHLSGGRLVRMTYGMTAAEAAHAAEVHGRMLGDSEPEGPDPIEVSVLKVADAAQATEVMRCLELLGWLRRHVDSSAWAAIEPLIELEDQFEPVALGDA